MAEVPFAIRANYQVRHYNAGIPQNPSSVFDALADPPETAVQAEADALAVAQANGVIQPDAHALLGAHAHRDWLREFYDSASILRPEA